MEIIMKILIATDGSEFSKAAVEACCRMTITKEDTAVKVISVFEMPVMAAAAPYAMPIQYDANFEKGLRELAQLSVAKAEEQIRQCFPDLNINLTTETLCGVPEQAIVEKAEEWGADLIVVGSHAYGFWERMFLGSVSNAIVHHAPCSVMVVRKPKSENGRH
jgi:nucleotide-binding universal stress UspA family protein